MAHAEMASLEESRRQLQGYQGRHEVGKLRRFRSVREAAIRFDRKDDYWTYEWAHESVPGSDAAWLFARRKIGTDSAALHAKTANPEIRAAFGEFAARSVTDAALATARILGWDVSDELSRPAARMRSLLDTLAG